KPRQTVGRTRELARLSGALERVRNGNGQVVVLQGMAGVGKTHLLRCAAESARHAGFDVMQAAGGPLTADVSFGIALELLHPLLEPWVDRPRPELAPLLASEQEEEIRPEESEPELASLSSVGLARLCAE